jgi:hypothetical protein
LTVLSAIYEQCGFSYQIKRNHKSDVVPSTRLEFRFADELGSTMASRKSRDHPPLPHKNLRLRILLSIPTMEDNSKRRGLCTLPT